MEEIWKDCVSWENYYQVSSLGNVRGLDRVVYHPHSKKLTLKGKPITPTINRNGYYQVTLRKSGHNKTMRVHRLMAIAFIPNPLNLPEVNHIDGNKLNNNLSNLEWIDDLGNTRHAHALGLIDHARGVKQAKAKLDDEKVIEMRKLREQGVQYKDIANQYGVNSHTARWACTGLTWAHVNYPTSPFRTNR